MAILEFTTSNLVVLGGAAAALTGGSYLGATLAFGSHSTLWAPFATSSKYNNVAENEMGKKFAQHIVDQYGSYNYFNNWVYSEDWWYKQYDKVKSELPNARVTNFAAINPNSWYPQAQLATLCDQLYGQEVPKEEQKRSDFEHDLWKFCSPVGYKPYDLDNSKEYEEYCVDANSSNNENCIIDSESRDLRKLLVSTGVGDKRSEQPEFKKLRSNDYFWLMRNQWYNHQARKDPRSIEISFKLLVDAVNKSPLSYRLTVATKDKITLKHVCEAAYRLKSLSSLANPLPKDVLVKYCGYESFIPKKQESYNWAPLATASGYSNLSADSLGKKYAQHLVHNYGSYNYSGKWVYSDAWWRKHYEKVKGSISEANVQEIQRSKNAWYPYSGLSSACTSLFGVTVAEAGTNLERWENDLWKFCSPVGYKPHSLQSSGEYTQYCNSGSDQNTQNCILDNESGSKELKQLLAATQNYQQKSNDYFWLMRTQWYEQLVENKKADDEFVNHVHAVYRKPSDYQLTSINGELNLKEVCQAAYKSKKLSKTKLSKNILVKYCGIASYIQ